MSDNIMQQLEERIKAERRGREEGASMPLHPLIEAGQTREAMEVVVFFTPPAEVPARLKALREELRIKTSRNPQNVVRFLAEMALALRSFLTAWRLQKGLSPEQLAAEADACQSLAVELAAEIPQVTQTLLEEWRAYAQARFLAEGADDPASEARALVEDGVEGYLSRLSQAINNSFLRHIAQARAAGETITELGNDYAAFLDYAMYVGASFVTSNPVLVDIAWTSDPARWDPIMQAIVAGHPDADDEALARLATLEVVFSNMRLLRPIFLTNTGRMGYVSLQVNPKKHGDAQAMINDATAIYQELEHMLDGGVPNVVFKLPGTLGGLRACHHLVGRGIGVNITVNYGLFQEFRFAEVIPEGQAIVSYLTDMNGRLAYPVRDELLGKLDRLAGYGINEVEALEAAAWSGVAIFKRLHNLLVKKGYDLTRVRPLVASLRWYIGPGYENLPSPCPDVTEALGTAVITVFPNIRRALDTTPGLPFNLYAVEAPVPAPVLDVLQYSEIFKQGYYVPDRNWVVQEDERFRPEYLITLEDEEATAAWPPVHNTIRQFSEGYDRFVERLQQLR